MRLDKVRGVRSGLVAMVIPAAVVVSVQSLLINILAVVVFLYDGKPFLSGQ